MQPFSQFAGKINIILPVLRQDVFKIHVQTGVAFLLHITNDVVNEVGARGRIAEDSGGERVGKAALGREGR